MSLRFARDARTDVCISAISRFARGRRRVGIKTASKRARSYTSRILNRAWRRKTILARPFTSLYPGADYNFPAGNDTKMTFTSTGRVLHASDYERNVCLVCTVNTARTTCHTDSIAWNMRRADVNRPSSPTPPRPRQPMSVRYRRRATFLYTQRSRAAALRIWLPLYRELRLTRCIDDVT